MKHKRLLPVLLAVCLCAALLAVTASAAENVASGSCGENVTWVLTDDGTMTVSGSGPMNNVCTWVSHRPSIYRVVLEEGVTGVGAGSFSDCVNLAEVILPESLTEISSGAFENCTSLTSITIPEGTKTIGGYALEGCTALEEIRFEAVAVEDMATNAFLNIGIDGPGITLTIGAQVELIPDYAFHANYSNRESNITAVIFEEGSVCERIGTWAFGGIRTLESIALPESLTSIDELAFYNCSGLERVYFGENLTDIGQYAFSYCTGIRDVYYGGQEDQWAEIAIDYGNTALTDAHFHPNADETEHVYYDEIVVPTCQNGGYTIHRCTCGTFYIDTVVNALGHRYRVTTDAAGYATHTCSVCGSSYRDWYTGNTQAVTENEGDQGYVNLGWWASVVNSYLTENPGGGYTRVEYEDGRVYVETYDAQMNFLSHREILAELPLFGGYYTDGNHHFLVFGQTNEAEDDRKEVVRVVKYSSDWQQLGQTGICGANTTVPFDAGSLRMTSAGDMLYIRTCHEMYASEDGLNHQANMTFCIRISDMTLADAFTKVWNNSTGYVSHSFNQFILADGTDLLAVDHGDAHPRAMSLAKFPGQAGRETMDWTCTMIEALPIAEASTHYNYTGACVGGFEISDSAYLIAGNSTAQDGTGVNYGQRNIFVTVTDKSDFTQEGTKQRWLTDFEQGTEDVVLSVPHLVKLGGDEFCILWMEDDRLCYAFLDGEGQLSGKVIRSSIGSLSDCKPVAADGAIRWYVTDGEKFTFYILDTQTRKVTAKSFVHVDAPRVKGSNVASSGKVKLTWDKVDGAASYKVYRATSRNGSYKLMKTTTGTAYTNTSAVAGSTYYYYVVAVTEDGTRSEKSSIVMRTCDLPRPVVSISNVASSGKIKLTWDAIDGAAGYQVYRATSKDGTYTLLKTVTGTSFTNTSAKAGTLYYYKVVAVQTKSAANSAYSSYKSRTCDLPRPDVTISLKNGKPRLTWTKVDGAVSYKVYRATSKNGTYSLLKTTTSTSFTNTGAKSGVTYYYKVIAVHSKSAANSAYSLIDSIKSK